MQSQPPSADWLLLLLADSALPTGGFIASSGLEAFTSLHHPKAANAQPTHTTLTSLQKFLIANISAFSSTTLPYLAQTHHLLTSPTATLDHLLQLDDSYNTLIISNQPANRASKAQGSALLTLLTQSFSSTISEHHRDLLKGYKSKGVKHYPICFAFLCAAVGVGCDDAMRVFLFSHVRGLVSACVRLNLFGPYEGQRWMAGLGGCVEVCLGNARERMRGFGDLLSITNLEDDEVEGLRRARKRRIGSLDGELEVASMDNSRGMNRDTKEDGRIANVFDVFLEDWFSSEGSKCDGVRLAEMHAIQTGFVVEVVQGLHERMYSRLFNS